MNTGSWWRVVYHGFAATIICALPDYNLFPGKYQAFVYKRLPETDRPALMRQVQRIRRTYDGKKICNSPMHAMKTAIFDLQDMCGYTMPQEVYDLIIDATQKLSEARALHRAYLRNK
ncbi:MAG: hypothetical protein LBQ48_03225 [Oscillospiraceae bacterium]|jgi:hypothetical protein|nr:hypothetical protein [Oscillospiraceae bacterium]